jgi:hypothetical protein
MYSVDIYSRVRRACLKDGMSAREAAGYFNKDRKTIAKMLRHELPRFRRKVFVRLIQPSFARVKRPSWRIV